MESTAILFFSRSSAEESRHKRFCLHGKNQRIAQLLIDKTLQTASESGLPLLTCFSENQRGIGFGNKLSNAISDVFQQGYDSVIVVGNDCIDLDKKTILRAYNKLKDNDCVLGPNRNGGLYLIGIKKRIFNSEEFENLPWQNSILQVEISNKLKACKSLFWLNTYRDINSAKELLSALASTRVKQVFITWLKSLVILCNEIRTCNFTLKLNLTAASNFLRGPPLQSSF